MTAQVKSGIYQIRHTASGKCYVGNSADIARRWGHHRSDLKKGAHHSSYLQRAWNKHGADAFEFLVLEHVPCLDDLVAREQFWINAFDVVAAGYNTAPIAGSNLGFKYSAETKAKMSAWQKGKKKAPLSAECRAKISAANRLRTNSPETRAKISAALKLRGAPKITQEQRDRSNVTKRGAKRTREQRDRISASLTGKPRSEALRAKLRAAWALRKANGYKRPESAIAKMRATWERKAALKAGTAA